MLIFRFTFLLLKVWWSSQNFSEFDDIIIIAAIALES